jgi:adenylate kinase
MKLVLGLARRIRERLQLKAVDQHNMGEIPVLFVPNLPEMNF